MLKGLTLTELEVLEVLSLQFILAETLIVIKNDDSLLQKTISMSDIKLEPRIFYRFQDFLQYSFTLLCCVLLCLLFNYGNAQTSSTTSTILQKDISAFPSISQVAPFKFKKIGEAEGIPKYIGHVRRDKKGFLWMDTKEGIVRYDGISTQIFRHNELDTNGLSSNFMRTVLIGQSNQIWAITIDFGLYKFNPSLEKFQKQQLSLDATADASFLEVTYLLEDSFGITWLATGNNGLNKLNPQTGKVSKIPLETYMPEVDFTYMHSMIEDRNGNLWVIGKHLFCILFEKDTRKIKELKIYPELGDYSIRTIVEDKLGNIWAAGPDHEIHKIQADDQSISVFNLNSEQKATKTGAYINELFVDNDGYIWVANNLSGLTILDPISKKVKSYLNAPYNPFSLSKNDVIGISGDYSNGIWISTWGGGLNYYNPNMAKFGHFYSILNNDIFLSDNDISTFHEDKKGIVWIGTKNGLNKFNRATGQITPYLFPTSILLSNRNKILSILADETLTPYFNGSILIGSQSGLITFDPKSEKFSKWKTANKAEKSLETDFIYGLRKDKKGMIWANTYHPNQVFKFDTLSSSFYLIELIYKKDTLKDIDNIVADFQGNYWLGTKSKGLFKLDLTMETLSHYNIKSNNSIEFKANLIRCFWKDRQNRQWIGTELGLFLLEPVEQEENTYHFQRFNKNNGLPGIAIAGIIEDNEGTIWLSTQQGLAKLDTESMTFTNYNQADGLQGNQFNYNAAYRSPSSHELYFGGTNGFNVFDPKNIERDTIPPFVEITDIKVFRDSQMLRIIPDKNKEKEKTANVSLFYGDKLLQINYAALHFAAPLLNQYAVQLEGYDSDWRLVGNEHEAVFTNLDPGNYVFRVKAANKDGVWNDEGTALDIVVYPPWWETWWAYVTYAFLAIGGLVAFYRFQLNRKLEKIESLRLKEMDTLKSRFFANVSHELRTPLTLILGPINASLKRNKLDTQDFTYLKMARRNGNQLLLLVNSILDLSKLEVNKLSLQETAINFYPLMKRLVAAFESSVEIQAINLSFNYPPNAELHLQLDVPKFEIIINNLLSNALKFTPKGGKIDVQVQASQSQIEIKVTDTGKGITPEDLPFIFDRYYQTKKSNQPLEGGTGIGLALCKEYTQLFKGAITAKSVVGKGSTFTLVFPKKEATTVITTIESTLPSLIENSPIEILPAPITNGQKDKAHLLIVEDNKDMRLYIQSILGEKFQCHTAENGQIAWDYLNDATKPQPDLILSDLMMPFMDGFELLKKIKADDKWRTTPVIMLTARSAKEDRLKALTIGIDDYLIKPFDSEELVVRVNNLLQNHLARKIQIQKNQANPKGIHPKKIQFKPVTAADIEWLQEVTENIKTDIGKFDLNLLNIAYKMAISERHLRRRILDITGMNGGAYLKEIRLQQARHFLESKAYLSVAEVGYAVGFNTPNYFTKIYKARFGKLPSAYF